VSPTADLKAANLKTKGTFMNTGVICTYFSARKFGFIRLDDGSTIFFHATNFQEGTPKLGGKVSFELGDPVKLGLPQQAVNVAFVEGSTAASNEVSRG
jgi:cold shock CspA family protein